MMEKDKEYDTIAEWIKKSKKLKKTYESYEKLREHCLKVFGLRHFVLHDAPDEKMIVVEAQNYCEGGRDLDRFHGARDVPTYLYGKDKKLVRFDPKKFIDEIAPILAAHVDRVELMKDVLADESPQKLQDLYERTVVRKKEKKKTSIKARPECFFLDERLFIRN